MDDRSSKQQQPPNAAKVKELEELAPIIAAAKAKGKRVVQCHGCFDLLHLGHIRHFESAKRAGDVLVVTITPDQYVNKGPNRPAFTHGHRAEVVASLACVDYVAINRWPGAEETLKLLKPTFYAKGSDYRDASKDPTGGIQRERDAIESVGGELIFTDEVVFSSSTLINRQMSTLNKEASDFLAAFNNRYTPEQVLRYLDGARGLKVLVIGETIIDDYHYCQALGKSGKEPILAVRYVSSEKFAGGILAVANHVASFCDTVGMHTFLGAQNSQEEFIRHKLSPKVTPTFFHMANAPTIVKRRYVESYPFQKMFEVYEMNEDEAEGANAEQLCQALLADLPKYDLVIVTDYGHGMLSPPVVDVLCRHAKCLAVNTQANAANHGFNTVSKYPRADYLCVSEKEMRLEARQRRQDLRQIVERVAKAHGCAKVTVTRGSQGMLCYGAEEGFVQMPALSGHFTDRVGSGDAVFAVTSLCMVQKAPADILALVGNAVGAMAVSIVGNRDSIGYAALHKTISTTLK